jgi:hypothetical protein
MSKGAVIAVVVVGGVVLLGGAALVMAAPKPVIYPDLGTPPPRPPVDSLGKYIVQQGAKFVDEAIDEVRGGDSKAEFAAKCAATGGLYCGYKETVYVAKKIWNSIF